MQLRDLLVVLDDAPRNAVRLGIALDLARQHDARLTGICPLDLLMPPNLGMLIGGYPDALTLQVRKRPVGRAGTRKSRTRRGTLPRTAPPQRRTGGV